MTFEEKEKLAQLEKRIANLEEVYLYPKIQKAKSFEQRLAEEMAKLHDAEGNGGC